MKERLINIMIGNRLNENADNLSNYYSDFVPSIGDGLMTKKFGKCIVEARGINLNDKESKDDIDSRDETIILYCKRMF